MSGAPASGQRSTTSRALFGFLFFLYLLTSSGRVRTIDEVLPALETESLANRGDTSVPQAVASGIFYGKLDRNGRPQAPYGAGQALATLPWFALGRAFSKAIPGIPAAARDIACDAVVVASSTFYAALAVALFYLLLGNAGVDSAAALFAALLLGLATPVFAYSSWFFSEPLAAALLLGAAVALFPPDQLAAISPARALLAGGLLGVALWVRPTHVLSVPVYVIAAALRSGQRTWRTASLVALAAALCGASYLVRNQILFGNFLDFGYPEVAEGGRRLNTFQTPLATGLYGLLFSPGKSLFLFAPPLLLALPGWWPLARRSKSLAMLSAATPLIYLLFFARYTQWEGGYCFGPRYLVPVIPLFALGLGPVFARSDRRILRVAGILALAGFLVQAIGMGTSFLEDQASGAYYDSQWNYRLSYSPLTSQGHLLLHYLKQADPAPIGRGFDRWFVFLFKAGVESRTLWMVAALEFAGILFFGWKLFRTANLGSRSGIHATEQTWEGGGDAV